MFENLRSVFAALLLLIGWAFPLPAQIVDSSDASTERRFSTTPFDTSVQILPRGFQGNDPEVIHNDLFLRLASIAAKDEFETSEEYVTRMNGELERPILPHISLSSTLALRALNCQTSYDADKKQVRADCDISTVIDRRDITHPKKSLLLRVSHRFLDPYVGTNAFGASVEVERSEWYWLYVVLLNYHQFPIATRRVESEWPSKDREVKSFSIVFSSEREEARRLKSSLCALLVISLSSPFATKEESFERATLDNPQQMRTTRKYLHGKLIEIWFYDEDRGTVLYRMKPSDE